MKIKKRYTFLGLVILICTIGSCSYSSLITKDDLVKAKWNSLQSQYAQRSSQAIKLVEFAKEESNFEPGITAIIKKSVENASTVQINANQLSAEMLQKYQAAQGELSDALNQFFAASEKNSDISANASFSDLEKQLKARNDQINVARIDFNGAAQDYDNSVKSFPDMIFAKLFGFSEQDPFQAEAGTNLVPKS